MGSTAIWLSGLAKALFRALAGSNFSEGDECLVKLSDVPRVVEATAIARSDGTFSVLLVESLPAGADDVYANVQFSIENGRLGFDWVLEAERNRLLRSSFEAVARTRGYIPEIREGNGVQYLRVEGGDLAGLCSEVLTSVLGVDETSRLTLIAEGFTWP